MIQDADEALAMARQIGFPVIIKASAGGGGKGMRVAADEKEFASQVQMAQNEAQFRFRRRVRVPGEVPATSAARRDPGHCGDSHGTVVHLGERECSIQRRHQKLIEEAPSPAVNRELRTQMGEAAVRGARSIGYSSAGTVEFLLDQDGHFYFMEMNTRIQVEHPVTEMVTGIDLVKEQIRVAAGEKLGAAVQAVREFRGHAIECRINAEDPEHKFVPRRGASRSSTRRAGPAFVWTRTCTPATWCRNTTIR